jgi:dihydroxyacetone kinase
MGVKPKQVLNDPSDSVSEFLEGLLLQYPNRLRKLENHHVILSAAHGTAQADAAGGGSVRLISGGGSGHEPSHAGWVGPGMLSAAVCGGIFASPSVHSILAAIRAVAAAASTSTSVLLIIKNYTGDRLNFGMAAERAAQEGIRVEMVVRALECLSC